jgi:hypothetical protein
MHMMTTTQKIYFDIAVNAYKLRDVGEVVPAIELLAIFNANHPFKNDDEALRMKKAARLAADDIMPLGDLLNEGETL